MLWLLIGIVILLAAVYVVYLSQQAKQRAATVFADAAADARQMIERLAGQVYHLSSSNEAAKQALADASERHIAAGSQIEQAHTPVQARLAKQTATEGMYYIRAARIAMGMDPGPPIPALDGQDIAGKVTEKRIVPYNGRYIAAAPTPSDQTPNYYPGGRIAGRPVPAGWYSEPWWRPALLAGAWGLGSVVLFSSLFSGMSGVGYDAQGFEAGYGEGYQDGLSAGGGDGYDSGSADGFDGGGFDGGF